MAVYEDLSLTHRLFLKSYPFHRYAVAPVPCAALKKPLRASRVALVTTAGLRMADQPGFDKHLKAGDATFREIPNTVETQVLIEDHKSSAFDHTGIQADRNLAFPLDRFRELERAGEIGALNHRHFSFMGSIINPRRLIEETSVTVAEMLRADGVDVAFLTPA
jgi:D-proline reductase (dithiol) PrdB